MIFEYLIIILGLATFEVISSIDNAIINAHVLKTMPEKFRKFFLFWGLLFAVFLMRGILPFFIVWLTNPKLTPIQLITFVFSGDKSIQQYIEKSQSLLLSAGGIYLLYCFLSWLFLEEKKYAFLVEKFIHRQSIWFYAIVSIVFTFIIYVSLKTNPLLALAFSIGSTVFFITDGFKKNAEAKEKELLNPHLSAWSKILYLEVLDASFSIDGVIGAFAFTVSVLLILLGNGLGAFIVREFTIKGTNLLTKFAYLKNGAMYSIGMLGLLMIFESFGKHYPFWLAPLNTSALLGFFLYLSYKEIQVAER